MTDLSERPGKPGPGASLQRFARLEHRKTDEGVETFAASLSSDKPYLRWFGYETLSHTPDAVDLSRAEDGLPLLFGHDAYSPGTLIGRAENLRVEGGKLRADLRFFSTDQAQQVATAVREGHREMSIGYEWIDYRETRGEKGEPDAFEVTRWRIFEASVVSVPADASVGVGRQFAAPATPPAPAVSKPSRKEIEVMENLNTPAPTVKPEDLERARVSDIIAAGETYAKYLKANDIADAIRNGWSTERFKDLVMKRIDERHADTKSLSLDMTTKEVRRYSFGRALQAAVLGDWSKAGFERECSEAMAKMMGRSPEGFFVPFEAWSRDFNVGTTTEAGNLVQTTVRGDLWVDALRNALVMPRLGARVLTGLTDSLSVPRKSTASTLGTLTEIGSASESNPLTAALSLTPKRVGAYVEASKQSIIQSFLSVEDMIRDDLLRGAAVQIEYLAINGNGTSPQHAGIRSTTGIGTVVGGTNGAAPAWSHVVDLESKCADANAEPDMGAGYLINTKTRGKLKQTQLGTNLPMIWSPFSNDTPLNNYRVAVSNNVPSNLTKGTSTTVCSSAIFSSDWSMEVLAFFGAPDVTVDPYTKADTGQVKITLNQFADSGVRQPGAFAKVDDLITG